ncbi:hypothetical protein O0544_10975 [Edwardsiella anguillarum]|nr:hypothetical protein [Edwardsiella anguillarum]
MHSEAWQAIIAQVTANAALYDWVKHCPLSIMRRWSARTVAQNGLICRQGDICQHFRLILQGEADIFLKLTTDAVISRLATTRETSWGAGNI